MKSFGLALSGGSAYGFAHIGVIKVLVKNNIPIDVIAGTSMGALIGGVFASGVPVEEMEKILSNFTKSKFFDINPFVFTDEGLLYGRKVCRLLKNIIGGNKKIEDLPKKFCSIASDLISANKKVFDSGDLITAIRASISVPGLFKPVKMDKMCLVDGGLLDNLPVGEARRLGADVVLGVDVCSYYKKENNLKSPFDIITSACNIIVSKTVQSLKDKGDIYLKIDQPTVHFNRYSPQDSQESIKIGERYAKKILPEIKKKLGLK